MSRSERHGGHHIFFFIRALSEFGWTRHLDAYNKFDVMDVETLAKKYRWR